MCLINNKQKPAFANWLRLRYPLDARARHRSVQALLLRHLGDCRELRVLDVGSGLGANTRFYAPLIPGNQIWTLLERDPIIAKQCLPALSDWAASQGYPSQFSRDGLNIEAARRHIAAQVVQGDLQDCGNAFDLARPNLVTANAVFDLVAPDHFSAFARLLKARRLPLLTTLNYRKTSFAPPNDLDQRYIGLYERHMRRPQNFGRALGPQCADYIRAELNGLGYEVSAGSSDWLMRGEDDALLDFMLGFMREAITEMLGNDAEIRSLEGWLDSKRTLAAAGQLELRVEHVDFFARLG